MRCPNTAIHRLRRAGLFCVAFGLTMNAVAVQPAASPVMDLPVSSAMQQFFERAATAHQYRAARRLEASGNGHEAWLDVQTEFSARSGLSYHVTGEGGSGYIRSRVLRSLLDEERDLIARGGEAAVALSSDNYEFTPQGLSEDGLVIVGIEPRRKDRSLIIGRMFLTPDGDLVRVEGTLAKNPSFWTTRVEVVRSYRRINDVQMPVSLETSAQLRMLGASALRMTYHYAQVDEREVVDGVTTNQTTR
jgi:hypothetical protein